MLETTHPDIAALVDPLFAFGGKRVLKILCHAERSEASILRHACPTGIFANRSFVPQDDKTGGQKENKSPLSTEGEERVVGRSDDRVSQLVDKCTHLHEQHPQNSSSRSRIDR